MQRNQWLWEFLETTLLRRILMGVIKGDFLFAYHSKGFGTPVEIIISAKY